MKKIKLTVLLLGGLMALSSLSSCDDKDKPEVMKIKSAQVEYKVSLSQDLFDAADVTIYYIDGNGEQAQDKATGTYWTKTVSFSALPAMAGFNVQPQLKGEPSREEYIIEASGQMTVTLLDKNQDPIGSPYVGNRKEAKGKLGPDFMGQYMTRISSRVIEGKAVDAEGNYSDITISWGGNAGSDDPNRDTDVTTEGATGTTRAFAF